MDIKNLLNRVKEIKLLKRSVFVSKFDKEAYIELRAVGKEWSQRLKSHKEGVLEHEFYDGVDDMEELCYEKIDEVLERISLLLMR